MINRLPREYAVDGPRTGAPAAGTVETPGERKSLSNKLLDASANCVGTHPVASLGVAFLTGILLGKWVKR
jgi:hypothetical protein